jgi:hypothetical protein
LRCSVSPVSPACAWPWKNTSTTCSGASPAIVLKALRIGGWSLLLLSLVLAVHLQGWPSAWWNGSPC